MTPVLRLYEDVLSSDVRGDQFAGTAAHAVGRARLRCRSAIAPCATARPRAAKACGAQGRQRRRHAVALGDGNAARAMAPLAGAGVVFTRKTHCAARHLAEGQPLLRGDSVAFPPGGCAYLHRHQGPGIRCLLEGGIRIDTHGRSTSYGPGGAWYETGPDAVFAQAADRPTRFIRAMILPRPIWAKARLSILARKTRRSRSLSSTRFLPICR